MLPHTLSVIPPCATAPLRPLPETRETSRSLAVTPSAGGRLAARHHPCPWQRLESRAIAARACCRRFAREDTHALDHRAAAARRAPGLRSQEPAPEPARFLIETITVEGPKEAAANIVRAETLLRAGRVLHRGPAPPGGLPGAPAALRARRQLLPAQGEPAGRLRAADRGPAGALVLLRHSGCGPTASACRSASTSAGSPRTTSAPTCRSTGWWAPGCSWGARASSSAPSTARRGSRPASPSTTCSTRGSSPAPASRPTSAASPSRCRWGSIRASSPGSSPTRGGCRSTSPSRSAAGSRCRWR